MKNLNLTAIALILTAGAASAATFTPTFDTPDFTGTQFNVEGDPAYNAFYTDAYGITVENAYLYRDNRDTFDGIGLSAGERQTIGSPQSGRINFLDSTDFVSVDYVALRAGTYQAYGADNSLIDAFSSPGGNGTETLSGGIISYLTFSGTGGFVNVSSLTYNFDGTTDGVNDDITPTIPTSAVPLPAGLPLVALGLFGLHAVSRRKKTA